ncbi:hypothetical protein GCM10025865_32730 [Paraoerskovia sediminicola]|uniref:Uncharacterized protein n=1 Tax=Paraoerskovia sediminicola TaxID=1138587 RepID=A0ABM8FYB5_9CELL|nr:hypothetical protein [Paraoerskovia sediminicola]BDZ40705.1 hypothetical protein GCM10025865_00040 [Paraoerskovia sediminicola]BDZ43974.1 hypothetical protein GCM10025865_32730 [Paraoerskovia sediminicola]
MSALLLDAPVESSLDLARPGLTIETLVALDIEAYSRRPRAAARATMEAQASTRPSPVSLRKNGTADGPRA